MYNAQLIQNFLDKVNEEAEQAAQAIFDKYEYEYKKLVTGQLKKGDYLRISMGSAYFEQEAEKTDAQDNFETVIASNEYLEQRAAFKTNEFKKHKNSSHE